MEYAQAPAKAPLWNQLEKRRPGNWFHLLNTGPEAMEWRLRSIDSATQSIDLQTFLWMPDDSGMAVVRHLFQAADRGVKVRLLVDDMFLNNHADIVWDIGHHVNIEYRIYNPFNRRAESFVLRQLENLNEFSRLDHRMHNKAMIIDNHVAIIGGRNLADEYFGAHEGSNFRDLEVLVSGPFVPRISGSFDEFWNNPWSFPVDAVIEEMPSGMDPAEFEQWLKTTIPVALDETRQARLDAWLAVASNAIPGEARLLSDHPALANPGLREELPEQLAKTLNEVLAQVEEELVLVSAYLIPTPELELAIEQAEARGVKVRILTNSLASNNHTAAHSAYRHHIHTLLGHGAQVHEVRAAAKDRDLYILDPVEDKELGLHAKVMLMDDHLSFIGSANLDPRSLRLNTELGLLIESPELNRQVREAMHIDFLLRNAWHLQVQQDGKVVWVSDDETRNIQPADSAFQRLEDWFLSILPIEGEM